MRNVTVFVVSALLLALLLPEALLPAADAGEPGITILILQVSLIPSSFLVASEPVCTYRNSEDETIFLKYLPLLKRGEDYVDFGKEGKCLKRAICTDTFKTVVEK